MGHPLKLFLLSGRRHPSARAWGAWPPSCWGPTNPRQSYREMSLHLNLKPELRYSNGRCHWRQTWEGIDLGLPSGPVPLQLRAGQQPSFLRLLSLGPSQPCSPERPLSASPTPRKEAGFLGKASPQIFLGQLRLLSLPGGAACQAIPPLEPLGLRGCWGGVGSVSGATELYFSSNKAPPPGQRSRHSPHPWLTRPQFP